MALDVPTIISMCEAHWNQDWNRSNRPGLYRNFLRLSHTLGAKIAGMLDREALKREYDWLEHCRPLVDSAVVVLPKPHGPLITHDELTILVMDYIEGVAVEDLVRDGKELSDNDADRISDAYIALRCALKPEADKLCPTGEWELRGRIFQPDGDGGLIMASRTEFNAYMDDRLTLAHDGRETKLPYDEVAWNNGDLSPQDIRLLDGKRVAFLDQGDALWGPYDWDAFALHFSPYDSGFVVPLLRAFDRKGITLQKDRQALYEKFMIWHAKMGGSVAR